jgi:GNAT superfamily N-acetyltransferase
MAELEKPELIVERLQAYTPEDAKQLGLLRSAINPGRSDDALTPSRIAHFTEHSERALIAARVADSGRIVACETIVGSPVLEGGKEDPDMFGWLGFVSTLPESRNQGIGKQIAIAGMRWCQDLDIRELKFTSNSHNPERIIARETYLKYGARIVAEGVGPKDTDLFNWNVQLGLEKLTSSLS